MYRGHMLITHWSINAVAEPTTRLRGESKRAVGRALVVRYIADHKSKGLRKVNRVGYDHGIWHCLLSFANGLKRNIVKT